jgi:hypothetical protein
MPVLWGNSTRLCTEERTRRICEEPSPGASGNGRGWGMNIDKPIYTNNHKLMEKLRWLGNRMEGYDYTVAQLSNPFVRESARGVLNQREEELNELIEDLIKLVRVDYK